MKRQALLLLNVILLCATIGCSDDIPKPATQSSVAAQQTTSMQPTADPNVSARAIDSIIYSDLSKDQMIEKLRPYVAFGESLNDFWMKTGIRSSFGTDWEASDCNVTYFSECGIGLVTNPDGTSIQVILRREKTVEGKTYSQLELEP